MRGSEPRADDVTMQRAVTCLVKTLEFAHSNPTKLGAALFAMNTDAVKRRLASQ